MDKQPLDFDAQDDDHWLEMSGNPDGSVSGALNTTSPVAVGDDFVWDGTTFRITELRSRGKEGYLFEAEWVDSAD